MQNSSNIIDKLDDSFRKSTGFIGIDMDENALKDLSLRCHSIRLIQLGDHKRIGEYLEEYPDAEERFSKYPDIRMRTPNNGSGQIREVSKLLFLDAKMSGKLIPIMDEIKRVSNENETTTIVIIGSLAGGTGGGVVAELPKFISKEMESVSQTISLHGFFIGPEPFASIDSDRLFVEYARSNAKA